MTDALLGGNYELVVGASLDTDWSRWFIGFEVTPEGRHTRLCGTVADQAALHGLLAQLRDLGIPIHLIRRLPELPEAQDHDETKGKAPSQTHSPRTWEA
jgi:hypothetical protein